jgi:hypothetical protein
MVMLVSMIQKILLFLVLYGLESQSLHAQFESKKVPRAERRNTTLLSRYLCDGLSSDSAKVMAVSSWIVKNIQYDYRALLNGNWQRAKTSDILKRKKGLCVDFSNLFNDLCDAQGISSYTVAGYTKTFNYKPYDSLIKAEHAWNVVLVDGEWRPLDLTWSVGFTKQRKQKFRTTLYLLFGVPYRIKYKFVNELNNKFICTDASVFVKTHAPLQPYWQLLNTPVPLKVFEADTVTNFLSRTNQPEDIPYNYKAEIKKYRKLSDKDKHLVGAKQAFNYNPQNHRIMGLGYYSFGQELLYEIKEDNREELQMELLDSCITLFDSSMIYFDAFKSDLKRKLKRRQAKNTTYKKRVVKINKVYIKSLKDDQKGIQKQGNNCKKINTRNKSRQKKALRYKKTYKKKNLKKIKRPSKEGAIKEAKVTIYQFEIERQDTLLTEKMKINQAPLFEKRRQLDTLMAKQHVELIRALYATEFLAFIAKDRRFSYNEYSRSYLDPLKDTIGLTKYQNQLQYDSICDQYDSIAMIRDSLMNHVETIIEYQLSKLKSLERLKRSSVTDLQEDEFYLETTLLLAQNYAVIANYYDSSSEANKSRIKELKLYKRPLTQTIKQLKKEIKIEYKRYTIYASWHKHLYRFYRRQADVLKLRSKKAIRSCTHRLSDLTTQIKERDKEMETE